MTIQIREAVKEDAEFILDLSRELAAGEGYLDDHLIDARDLEELLFSDVASAACLLAVDNTGGVVGMLLYYPLPYAVEGRPLFLMEELYVSPTSRGQGIGRRLVAELAHRAVEADAVEIQWLVRADNRSARSFYEHLGGQLVKKWVPYKLDQAGIRELAAIPERSASDNQQL